MDFHLTAGQQKYKQIAAKLVEQAIASRASQVDEKGEYPWDNVRLMAEADLFRLPIPKKYEGVEEGCLTMCLVNEELARGCASTALIWTATSSPSLPIAAAGSEEQRVKFLPPLARGEKLGCFSLTEHGAGSDASAIQTTATPVGNNYRINGVKRLAGNVGVADIYLIAAKTAKEQGARGISLFIVEKGTPGFRVGKIERKMGLRGTVHGELILQDCRVPKANLVGQVNQGYKILMDTLQIGRLLTAAQALGIAQAALDEAVKFSKQRVQFGQPIGQHQAIGFMLADMATEINAARLLIYYGAATKDQGNRVIRESSMAKLYTTEMATRVVHKALQIHGGFGYTKDYTVERLYRDVRAFEIMEGSSQIQRLVISRELLR